MTILDSGETIVTIKNLRDLSVERMKADIARQQATVNRHRSEGHPCLNSEKQLQQLKESLARLK